MTTTTFTERISIEKALYLNEMPYTEYKKIIVRKYKNEEERKHYYDNLKKLCTEVISNNGIVNRTYAYSKNMKTMGRRYSNGIQGIMREVRGFLMNHTTDIDMKNAHPVILRYLCKLHNISCPNLEYFINNRDEIFESLKPKYNREEAKELFLKSMNNDTRNKNIVHPFFRKFDCETKHIQKSITDVPEYKEIIDTIPVDKTFNKDGSKMNRILVVMEDKILNVALSTLQKRNIEVASLMFDGCMAYGDYYQNSELLREIETNCEAQFKGLNMKWDYKPHDNLITIPEGWVSKNLVNSVKETNFADSTNNSSVVFARIVAEFEKTHAKIINRSLFVKETSEKTLTLTKQQMVTSYEHMECGVSLQGIPQIFIKKWLTFNDKIRSYDDMNIYPNPSKCPSNIYNLWRPFAMDTVKEKSYIHKPEALSFYLNHIKILCNNDEVVTNYIIAWIAQMIQYPEVKSIMPTFIAGEGIGKSTLIISLSKMMGASKILETTSPSRDVWGEFNGMMADAFLVHLCEISKKECVESRGKIKGLITDPTLNINNKGVGQYPVMSYHRFIATTNNEDSIPTEKGDRRNLVIRCSDEKKGDTEYFKQMYEYLEDVNVIRTLYDHFNGLPNMDKFHEIPLPKTEFQEDMKDSNRSPIELWLEDFTMEHSMDTTVTLRSDEVFSLFKSWISSHNMAYDVNAIKFMVRLKNLNIDGISTKPTKTVQLKIFDISKLEIYFGLNNLPDTSSEYNTDIDEDS